MPDVGGRRPVLAIGSNQSPEQLARKFIDAPDGTGRPDWGPIPVVRVKLQNFDSVYSPHLSSYGALPATLQYAPGTTVSLFVTWLTPRQESRMHETELGAANYRYGRLENISATMEFGEDLSSLYVYRSERGVLLRQGSPVTLAEIPAENRRWTALGQVEAQQWLRDWLEPDCDLNSFISDSITRPEIRQARTTVLAQNSQPFGYADFVEVPV